MRNQPDASEMTLEGSCHCEQVRYRVRVSPRADGRVELLDCNCSICTKKGYQHLIVEQSAFELLSGEEHLTTYRFNTRVARHRFCRTCGVQCFYIPRSHPTGVSVNARTLDCTHPLPDFDLRPFDGQNWEANIDQIAWD